MAITSSTTRYARTRTAPPKPLPAAPARTQCTSRRIASNFVFLSAAEIFCRGVSVAISLSLTRTLGMAGYGRIEFAFNVVMWLVLIVRDSIEWIAARELARHPRLIRPLVNHVLAAKVLFALTLFAGLNVVGLMFLKDAADRWILFLYGLMLLNTAMGIDFVYRGTERMLLIAVSLCLRTTIYAFSVLFWVTPAGVASLVPLCLAIGEGTGIALVWFVYSREYGFPRLIVGLPFLKVFLRRGRSVCLIQVCQTIIYSVDVLIVGSLMLEWADVGRYSAPHRVITAILTFGLIFQQVAFPMLARSWRQTAVAGRETLNGLVQVLVIGLLPVAVGGSLLAGSLVELLPKEYSGATILLAVGIWRAPLLTLAFLYQTTLIAVNRESAGVRLLLAGAAVSGPLMWVFCRSFGLVGVSAAVVLIAFGLVVAGYGCLAREGRQPAWHHHLGRPVIASLAMVPVCLALRQVHVLAAVAGGAVVYLFVLTLVGGLRQPGVRALFSRGLDS